MSGIKSATVRNTLEKVVALTRAGIAECERAAAEAGSAGRSACDSERKEANRAHAGIHRALPDDLRVFLKDQTARWESLVRLHDEKFAEANRLYGEADGREKTLHAGETLVEMVDTVHYGENRGTKPAVLYMFYLSQKDLSLSVLQQEEQRHAGNAHG